jgi:hypothetical protein
VSASRRSAKAGHFSNDFLDHFSLEMPGADGLDGALDMQNPLKSSNSIAIFLTLALKMDKCLPFCHFGGFYHG